MKAIALFIAALGGAWLLSGAEKGWIEMFNGKTLEGWKTNERPESWTAKDGAIVGDGEASHLFWLARECENWEFKADAKTSDAGNSGMYLRTTSGPAFPKVYKPQV